MRLSIERFGAVSVAVGACVVGATACAQTTWGYVPTNAFPSLVFSNPVCITSPPGETNRLFVLEKHGRITVITNLASPTRTVFMDISGRVSVVNSDESGDASYEEGLLGLAFHPGYATNRCFYVFYTGQATNGSGSLQLHDILSRFQTTSTNANVGDPNSEVRFIAQYDLADNHNAGDLHFGSDGYLYVSLGDEGGGGDQYGNSQHIDKDFFSAIMRIDVDKRPGNLTPNPHVSLPSLTNYAVPFDNPWVGATNFNGLTVNSNQVRTEFWAVGMRNPWRWSFDPATGELYLGHVGQNAIEWVDIVTNGANCGWNYYEGDNPYAGTPPTNFLYTHPLIEYSHTGSRVCVIGGIVCRGTRWPELNGSYLYADYGSGEVWSLRHNGTNVIQNAVLFTDNNAHISCFGIDPSNGDPLYAALFSGNNSIIERIVSTNSVPFFSSLKISGANLVASGTNGPHGGSYYLLTSTNLMFPFTNWTRVSTNPFDAGGGFIFTNPLNPGLPALFYLLQLQ
ncbi:MAG: PQQ-dependent sugar dehydrogenase [Verrucomicrobiota bacterium]|jgi:glucose/arabinose dehydrogenase